MSLTKVSNSMITGAPINVLDYGAVGNGVADDTAAIQAAFSAAAASGQMCIAPTGTYLITNLIQVSVTSAFQLECNVGTTFKAASTFPANTKLFDFVASATGTHKFIWKNGTIDGRLMPAKTITSAPDLMSVSGSTMTDTLIDNASFLANDTVLTGTAGDSCLFLTEGQNYTVSNCYFIGALDAAIYVSGNAAQTTGRKVLVIGNTFERCNVAYISKRSFEDQVITDNFVIECLFGIVVGGEADVTLLPGKKTVISSNILKKVEAPIQARVANGSVIADNRIEDPGTGPSFTPVQSVGINLQGSDLCIVTNNFIGALSYTPAANTTGIAVTSFTFNSITYLSDNNLVCGNLIYGLPRGIYENAGEGTYNTITSDNKYVTCTTPVTVTNTGTINGQQFVGVAPIAAFQISSGGTDQKLWRMQAESTQFQLTARKDDDTLQGIILGALRSSTGITQLYTTIGNLTNYADDTAAAAGGVIVGGFYRTASAVKIRVT